MTASLLLASGRVFAEDAGGAVRVLQNGAELAPGEVVVTGAASAAVFHVTGAGDVSLGGSMRWDPDWGAPRGEVYQSPAADLALQTDELGLASQEGLERAALNLSEIFEMGASIPVSVAAEAMHGELSTPDAAELVSELAGLLRALHGISGFDASKLLDLQNELAGLEAAFASGSAPSPELVQQLFALLDRAADLSFQEYARHAGEEVSRMAGGEAALQVEELHLGPMGAERSVDVPMHADAGAESVVLEAHSVLEDLTVQPLGDLLHVENIAGATRMTMRDGDEEDSASLWLDAPLGGIDSLLGFDAPEFVLPDTA